VAAGRFYQINQYIQAKELRVIDKDGKQIGIIPTGKALEEARKQGLDLVEIVPKAKPPVCKIIDFRRFLYEEKKKRQSNHKKKKQSELKQIRLGLFIDGHDLQRRIKKAEKFLKNDNKVKFSIALHGRKITKREFGLDLFEKVKEQLKETAKLIQEPKLRGRILEMTLKSK